MKTKRAQMLLAACPSDRLTRTVRLQLFRVALALLAALTLLGGRAMAQVTLISNGVDPITGWQTNGVLIEAVNIGPPAGSVTTNYLDGLPFSFITNGVIAPATVNGITFKTNLVNTTYSIGGTTTFASSPNGWDPNADHQPPTDWPGYYPGSNPNALTLYTNFAVWANWTGNLTIDLVNLIPGQSYQAQVILADTWNGFLNGSYQVSTSTNGGADAQYFFVYDAETNLTSVNYTFTAGNNFAQIDFYEDLDYYYFGISSIFGYTLFQLTTPTLPVDTALTPANTVYAGTPVAFSVVAGGAPTLKYQWLRDGAVHDATATNSVYTLSSPIPADSGNYQCVISNSYGSITSSIVTLTVNQPVPPFFTSLPVSATRPLHGQYTLNPVVAGSPPFQLQWRLNGNVLPNKTNATLSLTDVLDAQAGNYVLAVTNSFGRTNTPAINLNVTPGMVLNPYFGDQVSIPSFANWTGDYCTGAIDPTSTYGTCCSILYYETIHQDTGYKFAPNTLYEVKWSVGPSDGDQYYALLTWDAGNGSVDFSNWVNVATDSGSVPAGSPWTDCIGSVSTSENPSVVGHDIGIGMWVGNGYSACYVTDVRLIANPPPSISGEMFVGPGQFQFTMTSVPNRLVNIYVSLDLINWTLLDSTGNFSGSDTYVDTHATAKYQFYKLQQE